MGMRRVCDVYGSAKDVKRYRVTVAIVPENPNDKSGEPPFTQEVDLCPRGLNRLDHFLKKGMRPASERTADQE